MKRVIFLFAVIICLAANGALMAGGVGTTGAQFLKIDPAARPLGMGGAYSAVCDDSSAVFYNPAGIAHLQRREIAGTYLKYFQSINYGSISAVLPSGDNVFGIGINYLGVTDIEKREADDVDDPTGTADADTFGAMDTAIAFSYARKNAFSSIAEGMDLGANLRVIYQTIDEESAFSAMIDAGAYYPVDDKLSLSLVVQNIGLPVKFREESDPLPFNIKAGAAYRPLDGLTVACDINEYLIDEIFYASLGAEYWIKSIVALRAGYKYGYDTESLGSAVGFAGGMGVSYMGFGLDYSFAPFGELGDTHRVSFSAGF